MLAYAPRPARRRFHPAALTLIAAAHAAAILAVMSARMALPDQDKDGPTVVETIPLPPEPKPPEPEPRAPSRPMDQQLDLPPRLVPLPPAPGPSIEPLPVPQPNPGPAIGDAFEPVPPPPQPPAVIRTGPRFATPAHLVRPPYPEERRLLDQEATLRLRLSIDASGRVTAVEPVGRADPAFLAAARKHILKAWRYKPAMEGEQAIASSTVVTLKFELD